MKAIKKILVPVDFSDNSMKILESAQYFAQKCDARLTALFVVQSFDDYSGFFVPHMPVAKFEEEMVSGAEGKMDEFLKDFDGVDGRVILGDVSDQIIGYAEQEGFDMIVMGTHGYKGLEKMMFGSVAEKVVKSAACPVLTLRPYQEND